MLIYSSHKCQLWGLATSLNKHVHETKSIKYTSSYSRSMIDQQQLTVRQPLKFSFNIIQHINILVNLIERSFGNTLLDVHCAGLWICVYSCIRDDQSLVIYFNITILSPIYVRVYTHLLYDFIELNESLCMNE